MSSILNGVWQFIDVYSLFVGVFLFMMVYGSLVLSSQH